MNRSQTIITIALASGFLLAGCGPTATGIQAREDARTRLDRFGASVDFGQAQQQFESGELEKARRTAEHALSVLPEDTRLHILLGRINLESHQLEGAEKAFRAALEFDENLAEAHYYLGIIAQRWSQDDGAVASYRSASESEPQNLQYLLAWGEALIATGKLDDAQRVVNDRLAYFEYNSNLRVLLAQIEMIRGDLRAAAQIYEQARMLDPENEQLLEELALVYWQANSFASCLATLQQMHANQPDLDRDDLRRIEARCCTMVGRIADAHKLYRELCAKHPSDPQLWIEFGALAWELGDFGRLAKCGRQASQLAPERFEGWLYLGVRAREQGDETKAMQHLAEATARARTSPLPALLLGRLHEARGDTDLALQAYRHALGVDPACTEAKHLHTRLAAATSSQSDT